MALSILSPDSLDLTQDFAGIHLGGTGSANQLDDYETGTFTATYEGLTTNPTTAVTTTGYYTKIGNLVFINVNFSNVDTTGASGGMQVSGLPFTAVGGQFATGDVMIYSRNDIASNYVNISVYAVGGTTKCQFYATRPNAGWLTVNHSAGSAHYMWFSATYLTN